MVSFGSLATATVPTLDQFFPIALQAGTATAVTAVGKFDPWPPKVWVDVPGIVFKPETNSGLCHVEVGVSVPAGPHLVRFYNDDGCSQPRFLIVTREPQLAEVEPNDQPGHPQPIDSLPAWVVGRLEKAGDVDGYGVHVEAGQTLLAGVQAYVLGSPIDAVLRVTDMRGVQLAWNHDDGRTLDPFLAFTAPAADDYVVQVFGFAYPADSDVRFTGNPKCVYRLHLSCAPYLRHSLPLGVTRSGRTSLQVVGWNLAGAAGKRIEFDGRDLPKEAGVATLHAASCENELTVPVGEGPEQMETEPNDTPAQAPRCTPPFAVTGRIDRAGDEDRVVMAVKKGDSLRLEVRSVSPELDAWLKVETMEGKELQRSDDAAGRDPVLDWSAPGDGSFVVALGNVLHRGGAEFYYRLSVARATPSVQFKSAAQAFTFEPGKTNELKLTVKFEHGAKGKWTASALGLPESWGLGTKEASEKGGELVWNVALPENAEAFSGPCQFVMKDSESGESHFAVHDLVVTGVDNGVPNGFNHLVIESIDQLWMTVKKRKPAPEPK